MIGFLIDFWSHLGAKIAPKTAQDGPKTRPRRPLGPNLPPKPPPRRPKTAPRCAQNEPKTATWPQLAENSRDLAKNCRDLAKNKAKNKDITHDCKRTPDIKAECCQTSSRPQSARTPKRGVSGICTRACAAWCLASNQYRCLGFRCLLFNPLHTSAQSAMVDWV